MNAIANLSPEQLRRAARIKEQIIALEKQLAQLVGAPVTGSGKTDRRRGPRGPMSPAAKAKLAVKMKAIWKARKAAQKK